MSHLHIVHDSDAHFTIDPITRVIINESKKATVIQHDHNSEQFTFSIPKVEGHDMSACNRVEIHYINIDATDKTKKATGVYEADDLKTSSDGSGNVTFSWLLSRNATQYAGSLNFLIRFACITDGVEEYAWNTAIFQSITVGSGMYNGGEEVIEPYLDVIAQWKNDLFGVGDTQEQRLLTVSAEQQAAIAAKGAAVLDSIPDEYEALQAQANENTRIKAGAIVLVAEGKSIVVNDASDLPVMGLKLFGKSTQDGSPTPDAPVDIVSVERPAVVVRGKNLINENNFLDEMFTKVEKGYKFTKTEDRNSSAICPLNLPAGQYVFSWKVAELQGVSCRLYVGYLDGTVDTMGMGIETNDRVVLNTDKGIKDLRFSFYSTVEVGSYVVFSHLQLEVGNEPTEYEPYIEAQFVETSYTLPGIPVTSGGNYTDENGQQWICDEVDLARGVYVQRIGRLVLDGNVQWHPYNYETTYYGFHIWDLLDEIHSRSAGLCNQFETVGGGSGECIWVGVSNKNIYAISKEWYDKGVDAWKAHLNVHPLEIVYARITPIETPLSDAEITAFKAMHSNKPTTTILNDAGAYMAVEYVADTKTYIDNKIAEALKGSEQA